jgi:hypothetical protein
MDINKLPKWAQTYIRNIERERETAIRVLNEHIDNQTLSPIYVDDYECTGEEQGPSIKRKYIQSNKITIEHQGVELGIILRDESIDIQWSSERCLGDVAFIPASYQAARLVSKKNMRD